MGNPLIHWELMVADIDKSKEFYAKIFDWKVEESRFPGYSSIDPGAEPPGAFMAKPEAAPGCALNVYFHVADIEETLAKAAATGAMVVVPKTEIPGMGWWAMFADPDGITLGVFEAL